MGAAPIYLLDYQMKSHTCTDPMLVMQVAEQTDSESFKYNIYSTVVTAFTYVFPILILPLALPIATLRTCISRQCCVPRYKQPIGELIMTSILCLIYLGTIVTVLMPELTEYVETFKSVELVKAPLLWELGNNATRPLVYFMTNPAVWDGLGNLCCRKKHQHINEDDDEVEQPLAPVTTV